MQKYEDQISEISNRATMELNMENVTFSLQIYQFEKTIIIYIVFH